MNESIMKSLRGQVQQCLGHELFRLKGGNTEVVQLQIMDNRIPEGFTPQMIPGVQSICTKQLSSSTVFKFSFIPPRSS